ncbi:AMP-binding protein [Archaeoglobus sp.]
MKELAYKIGFPPLFYPEITLAEQLEIAARRCSEKTALIYSEPKFPADTKEKMTFKELNDVTDKLASSLLELGIKKGERICVCIPNSPDYVVSVYALWKIGAVAVPVNPCIRRSN